jgi:hypothetical protein
MNPSSLSEIKLTIDHHLSDLLMAASINKKQQQSKRGAVPLRSSYGTRL